MTKSTAAASVLVTLPVLPLLPCPASPTQPPCSPVKLPAGYYRDVFINAVYDSLSCPFSPLPPHFPHLPSFFLPPPFFPPFNFSPASFCPPAPFIGLFSFLFWAKSHYFVNFIAGRRQRDLICGSHSDELIPNSPPILGRGSIRAASRSAVLRGFRLCLPTGSCSLMINHCGPFLYDNSLVWGTLLYIMAGKAPFYLCDRSANVKENTKLWACLVFASLMKV